MYLLDIVLALVPYLDEKRLELLEGKLKQLFSMVMRNDDRKENEFHVWFFLEGWKYQTKCYEKILSNFRRIMYTFDYNDSTIY